MRCVRPHWHDLPGTYACGRGWRACKEKQNKTKRKRKRKRKGKGKKEKKKYLSLDVDDSGCGWMWVDADGERGWVAVVADGRWWLRIGQGL